MSKSQATPPTAEPSLSPLLSLLRCPACRSELELVMLIEPGAYPDLGPDGQLRCSGCAQVYPIIGGTIRLLALEQLAELWTHYPKAADALASILRTQGASLDDEGTLKRDTAESFAYEWEKFGGLREEWRKNFLDYMRPHDPEWFAGKLILDAGAGSGRHSFHATQLGGEVVAVDLGRAIDVARRNLPASALTVQADVENLPLEEGRFDMVACIGVLPVVPDPERAFKRLVPFARPGGHVHIYVYWIPERRWHQRVLAGVAAGRRLTTRMPHRILHALCYPLSAVLYPLVVLPYRFARSRPALARIAEQLPLKTYADYPFGVLVNDQFDRLSAPVEHRHTLETVRQWFVSAGLEAVTVMPNHGWVGDGRRHSRDDG